VKISVTNASRLLNSIAAGGETTQYKALIARELVDDIARLDATLKASKQRIAAAVEASGTSLTGIVGVGPIGAATIIGYTKDITRFPTRGHYALYNPKRRHSSINDLSPISYEHRHTPIEAVA